MSTELDQRTALVVTISIEEPLWIGADVELQVVSVQGEKVMVRVVAPPEVSVDRASIRARKLAAQSSPALGRRGR
ncbi:carbon storage regulator [Telmatocola sphagniphila]|jgi:carbon storage regulator CsrA|uniref:Carbon storage regulator n=1 Tax=Telmatocola sphagniphila TaxID=1123043 RepID=A0A8E6EY52_9BACT|nr:carbon storage regulator [Telmatocola sphagniphila]QVL32318.1 carbon storage regulator [Telmatocola sphagniphila]